MTIRSVRENECNQLIEILKQVGWFENYFSDFDEEVEHYVRKHIRLCLADDSHSIYVAEENNKIVGYINVHWLPCLFLKGSEGYISELFVLEEFRGKNIGEKLLKFIEKEAKDRRCYRLSLLNGKNRESHKRNFYIKNGFVEREQLSNFIKIL